jgi:hypothetical protein
MLTVIIIMRNAGSAILAKATTITGISIDMRPGPAVGNLRLHEIPEVRLGRRSEGHN